MSINKEGYLVTFKTYDSGAPSARRTYACTDRDGLDALILHLTGREAGTFGPSSTQHELPQVPGMSIAFPLHIWSGDGE
jgi:hypothetical protein